MADYAGMSKHLQGRNVLLALSLVATVLYSSSSHAESSPSYTIVPRIPVLKGDDYDNIYPCTDCHSSPEDYNLQKRELTEEHDRITSYHPMNRKEDADKYWCNSCHQTGNYNTLTLNNGQNISFNESYKICLQCHGNYKDEFEHGIHGNRTGRWDSKEPTLYACANCHNPHDPKRKPVKPLPPPHPRHGVDQTKAEKK